MCHEQVWVKKYNQSVKRVSRYRYYSTIFGQPNEDEEIKIMYYSYKRIIVLSFILLLGCENVFTNDTESEEIEYNLSLYMNNVDQNGNYIFYYPPSQSNSYTAVHYEITPPSMQRVFWTSPDSFTIVYQGFPSTEPIINYSTYSNYEGTGKQHIYLNESMIGKTLTIIGCLIEDECEVLEFEVR